MPYNLLLIPLIAGYYLLSNLIFFKHKYERTNSQRLIFNSAFAGLLIAIVSFLIRFLFERYFTDFYYSFSSFLFELAPLNQRYLWTMIFGLFGVILLTLIINNIINSIRFLKNYFVKRAINKFGNEIEQMCLESINMGFALQVTLKNEKVYVGFVDEAPEPDKTNYLKFTPLHSGFRDPISKKMSLNNNYIEVINSLLDKNEYQKLSIMSVVIKQDEILTMSPHDPEIFETFNSPAISSDH